MSIAFPKIFIDNPELVGAKIAEDRTVVERVGNTPLIELQKVAAAVQPVRLFAKAEWYNPAGSVKDRAALNMILDGERKGELSRDKTILDATSGNTGIAYAMLGASLGYKVKLVIPANAGNLFKKILRAYGAELVYSDPQNGSDGAIRLARELFSAAPELYFYPDQYNNPANWQAHYNGTGKEIIAQSRGLVTHFVAGLGTSGTFVGTSRRLKEFNGDIKTYSVQPDSPFHGLEGLKHMETSIVPGIYDPHIADENIEVTTEEAQEMTQMLAREEGLLVGVSAGASAAAALKIGQGIDNGLIVAIFPDSAHKYFDQRFWLGEADEYQDF
jgi:cysteine synthase B